MSWNTELAYFVTPKSGPMRPMRTLVDVNRALLDDLPFVSRLRPHWAAVARLLLIASDTGSTIDVRLATDALVRALETEGWMTRVRGSVALSPADKAPSPAAIVPVPSSTSVVAAIAPAVITPAAVAPADANPMVFAVAPCRDAAPAGIGGPPVFGAPGYRPGEVVGPTARTVDDADDSSGLILRELPGGPNRGADHGADHRSDRGADRGPTRDGAPGGPAASGQGRGTRRPADTKL
ncbi:hypothetical protein [Rhodoplanes azumiensis]|uniref:Uncharacterized protein n=1 Tax=Rhodoplanes azumiensis TaxID=1897628 RepID=A0ABW5AMB8_9BRAD